MIFHGVDELQDGNHPVTGALRYNLTFRKAGPAQIIRQAPSIKLQPRLKLMPSSLCQSSDGRPAASPMRWR
jgi:hypothetical protein